MDNGFCRTYHNEVFAYNGGAGNREPALLIFAAIAVIVFSALLAGPPKYKFELKS